MTAAPLAVAVPLLGAALLSAVASVANRAIANAVSLLAATTAAVLCVYLMIRVDAAPAVVWFGGWHPRGGVALGVDFAVDELGAGLAAFVACLTVLALVMLARYRETDPPHLQALLLVFCAGMVGFCLSGDLFNMFVFFELMSVAAFALTGFRARQEDAITGALNFAVTNTVGSIALLLGIGLVYARTGALNLAQIGSALEGHQLDGLVVVALALIVTGFLIKAAAVPFHFWLADAYAVAPTPVCLLFAGAMSELGVFGIARVWFNCFAGAFADHAAAVGTVLVALGCLTALVGGVMSLLQDHIKRMLAFATIAYVGVFLVGLGTFSDDGVAGSALFIVSDGANKAALFAAVGIIQHRTGRVSLGELVGRGRGLHLTGAIFVLGVVSFAALPPSGAFGAKALIEEGLKVSGDGWAVVGILLASALTSAAVLRVAAGVFMGWGVEPTAEERDEERTEDEEEGSGDRTPLTLLLPAAFLAAAPIVLGCVPGVRERFLAAAARFVDADAYRSAVLDGSTSAYEPASTSFPIPTEAYLLAAATILGALLIAGAVIAARGRGWSQVGALGALLGPLRRLHSGHIGDYVAWSIIGLGAVGVAFAAAAGFPT